MIVLEKSNHVKINDDAIAKLVHTVPGHQFAGMTSKTGFNRFDSSVHFIGKEEKIRFSICWCWMRLTSAFGRTTMR